jgi:hypothetical protein
MDHFVKLDRMPECLEFPADLKERIHFEPETRKLVFRGYMSKSDFDRLSQLTTDWNFRRKLEELFRLSVMSQSARPQGVRRFLGSLGKRFSLG